MPGYESDDNKKAAMSFIWATILAVFGVGLLGLAGAIASGAFGFISIRLTALVVVAALGVFGAAIQAINAGLYHRSGFERRRSRR